MIGTLALLLLTISASASTFMPPCAIYGASAAGDAIWLLCERDQVLVTNDGGNSWFARQLPPETTFRAIHVVSSSQAYVAGDSGSLFYTDNGGRTWRRVPLPTTNNLTSIHFRGSKGWITGWGGVMLHSADGGSLWHKQDTGTLHSLESVFFADEQRGWAVGWAGTILRTPDGGNTWQKVRTSTLPASLNCVYFRDAENGWIAGFDGLILRSRDAGASWEEQTSPVRKTLTSVSFNGSGRGWIAADTDLLVSDDGGESWKAVRMAEYFALSHIIPVNGGLWAVGQLGTLQQKGGTNEWHQVHLSPGNESGPTTAIAADEADSVRSGT